jgi:hypothetical protein
MRRRSLIILCTAALALTPTMVAAQDANYLKRFLEEAAKKPQPVLIPPPTDAMLGAPPRPRAQAIEFAEARRLFGLDSVGQFTAARLPGGKLAIIDSGFGGLRAWLAARPDEARLTQLMSDDPAVGGDGDRDHGFKVYRVARAILPDAPILLYRVRDVTEIGMAMLDGQTKGVVLFNISLGFDEFVDVVVEDEDIFAKHLRFSLPQYEAFAFISAGNSRQAVHAWVSADRNANGLVDVRARAGAGQDLDAIRVHLIAGVNRVYFAWDVRAHPEADFALELVAPDGRALATARLRPQETRKGFIRLAYEAPGPQPALVRVRRLAGPEAGVFMRLGAYPIALPGEVNGVQTLSSYVYRENPFVIFVGSFGRGGAGLAPSAFSDIGASANGAVYPHVLGPGQLRLDGKELSGTSYASPFLTALYATRVGYNIKNLIERSASTAALDPAAQPYERSRWGVPDAAKLLAELRAVTGPTRIGNMSHAEEAGHLVFRFQVSRCCMESMTWYVRLGLIDPVSRQPLVGPDGKPIAVEVALRKDEKDFVRHPVEARIPLAAIAAHKGKRAALDYGLRVRAWRDPPPDSLAIDEAPNYRLTL